MDADALVLAEPVDDPEALRDGLDRLSELRSVTLERQMPESGFAAWQATWTTFEATYPQVRFDVRDRYQDRYADELETFSPTALPEDQVSEVEAILSLFPHLKTMDLSACPETGAAVAHLVARHPDLRVLWTDALFGPSATETTSLILTKRADTATVEAYLSCFPRLQEVDVREVGLSLEEGDQLAAAFPGVALRRIVILNGRSYDSFTEKLDLSKARIKDPDALDRELGRFPRLSRVEMHFCSLSNEQLADLREKHPQAGIVWTIKVHGRHIATDAVAYSSMQLKDNTSRFTSAECAAFQYCNKLIALDLGHNYISDISWLESMTQLQLLILADNRVKDLTPLKNLKQLKYVELFMNPITDISPLGELPELIDVNLCYCFSGNITDVSPLLNCKKLERIWLTGNKNLPQEQLDALRNAFPQAEVSYTNGTGSTGDGWREHPRYDAYIEMFRTNKPVAPFVPED